VISDSHEGLQKAVRKVLLHAPAGQRRMLSALIGTIFAQEGGQAARSQWRSVTDRLRSRLPKITNLMDEAQEDVLAHLGLPREHWCKVHSTNPLERLNGEIKRRTNVVGIFPNKTAIDRLVGAMLLEQNDEWALQRRYMTRETLANLGENPHVSLPALAS
jgi:transposase-like protein